MKIKNSSWLAPVAVFAGLILAPSVCHAQAKGTIVEQIVARVNNQIITMSDYEKASAGLAQEVRQDCQNCAPEQIQSELKERQKNLLRDMIDQQLLIARAKDMDIKLATLEDLEKAVESSGVVWEDYKEQLRNSIMTQQVIQREVGGRMDIGSDEVKKYYDAHKQDFVRPEEVDLTEIMLSTEGKSPEEIASVRTRAEDLHNRLVKGEDFNALAKRYSEGSTAQDNGALGEFQRGQLAKQFEDAVFPLEKGQFTDVIQTKTGFEILKVLDHYQAGLQPLDKVEGEITNILYRQKMQPAMRTYLAQLREESYVQVKPGYTDTAAVPGASVIREVAPTPDESSKKKEKKKLALPKVNG
jgi:peptidyl-prolyl cis-trans isomerase SurA